MSRKWWKPIKFESFAFRKARALRENSERAKRRESCAAELEQLLTRHNCRFDITLVVSERGIKPQVELIAD